MKKLKQQPQADETTRAAIVSLRSRSPFKKKTGESTNTSNFGAMGARGTTGKRKPPTLPEGAQGRAVEINENE